MFENSADPDEPAHMSEPSHQDLHHLQVKNDNTLGIKLLITLYRRHISGKRGAVNWQNH